jgi:hypothetical protein
MDQTVTIVIPARFNNKLVLDLNLRTVRKYTRHPYRLMVGDAGMDPEYREFVEAQKDIEIVEVPEAHHDKPKDFLARIMTTDFFMFLHDDAQILREGWLGRRMKLMLDDERVGLVGPLLRNFPHGGLRGKIERLLDLSPLSRRFFPFAFLIRRKAQEEIDLQWGAIKGFDTGGVAYLQYLREGQPKGWKYIEYPFDEDVKHWWGMTWIVKKQRTNVDVFVNVDDFMAERQKKVDQVQKILADESY